MHDVTRASLGESNTYEDDVTQTVYEGGAPLLFAKGGAPLLAMRGGGAYERGVEIHYV